MAIPKYQSDAVNRYVKNHYDRVSVTLPKGHKDQVRAHGQQRGESLNAFISRAIRETMEREGGKLVDTRAAQDTQDDGGRSAPPGPVQADGQ